MKPKQDLISARQLACLTVFSLVSLIATTVPSRLADNAGPSAWLSPVFGVLPVLGIVFLLQYMYSKRPDEPLDQIFYAVLGQVFGRVVLCLYALWCLLQASFVYRFFGERIATDMFITGELPVLQVLLLGVCFWAVKGRVNILTRVAYIFAAMITMALLFVLAVSVKDIRMENLLPVNPLKTFDIARNGAVVTGYYGVIVYANFLSGRVTDRQLIGKKSVWPLMTGVILTVYFAVLTIGILGSGLASNMQNAFLSAVKNLSGFEGRSRFESIISALWTMPSFSFIALMCMVAIALLSSAVKLKGPTYLTGPIVFLIYATGSALVAYFGDAAEIYHTYVQYGNYMFQFGFPLLVLGVGKLRKKF